MSLLKHDQVAFLRFLIILFFIGGVLSCGGSSDDKIYYDAVVEISGQNLYPDIKNNQIEIFEYEFNRPKKLVSNKIFDRSISYLPLETSAETLIASIDQLIISEERIIILDKKTKSVFLFDLNGRFKLKISSAGQGPTEYRVPKRIECNPYLNAVEVLDNSRGLIQRYDVSTGNHIGTLKVGFGIHYFKLIKESTYAFLLDSYLFNEERYAQVESLDKQFLIADENASGKLEFTSAHLSYQQNSGALNHTLKQTLRFGSNGDLLANTVFNDTIYSFTENGFGAKYVFDFTKWAPKYSFAKESLNKTRRLYDEHKIPIINWFWETQNYVYANCFFDGYVSHAFISLKTGEGIYLESSDYMQAARAFINPPIGSNDTSLIYAMEPSELYEIKSIIDRRVDQLYPNSDFSRKSQIIDSFHVKTQGYTFLKLLDGGLKEDDNPVLVFAKPNFARDEN